MKGATGRLPFDMVFHMIWISTPFRDFGRRGLGSTQELGLYRQPQPARFSGNVVVRRDRGSWPLHIPYCALPPEAVLGVDGAVEGVLSIENLTTFHVEAAKRCEERVLILYSAGMPSPAWASMYQRILETTGLRVPVWHWGDHDEGGFRIAAYLASLCTQVGRELKPWRMHPKDVEEAFRRPADDETVRLMAAYARRAGWMEIAQAIEVARIVAEQEG